MDYLTRSAGLEDLESVSCLFNSYRIFYGQNNNLNTARRFIKQRLDNNESTIFIAESMRKEIVGFVQLYPSFSSVSAKKSLILNDLYVLESYRGKGVATSLMNKAKDYAIQIEACGLSLETGLENTNAQKLYEKLGYKKSQGVLYYHLQI